MALRSVGLTKEEEQKLIKAIINFAEWLVKKNVIERIPKKIKNVDLPVSNEDWVMKFDKKTVTVSFNTFVRQNCTFEYYQLVVLHEFFHLAVQKVPNKDDAVRIKDDFEPR